MEHQDWDNVGWNRPPSERPVKKVRKKPIDTDDPPPPPKVTLSQGGALQLARSIKKLTRKQLAQKINVRESEVAEVETSKGVLNKGVVRKMAQALGVQVKL
jgi:ribosome-binding protein aMBF1 (putative translation factor)